MRSLILCLTIIFLSGNRIFAQHDKTYEYLLQQYIKICQQLDENIKKDELQILLIASEKYKQGLPAIPFPAWSGALSALWINFSIQKSSKPGLLFYGCCLCAFYYSSWFLLDLSRFCHKDRLIQQYAQLESLIAGIEARLSKKN